MFHKFGRAMLRPVFDQKTRRDGRVDVHLRRALAWWGQVLALRLCERRLWSEDECDVVQLFCDARGQPAHLGAVVIYGGQCWWTHLAPPESVLSSFRSRNDNQIMGLELLAISLGMCSFEWLIAGRIARGVLKSHAYPRYCLQARES